MVVCVCVICQKSPNLTYPTLFEFCEDLWHQETSTPGLSCGVVCMIVSLAILTQYRQITYTQRHTMTSYIVLE